MNFFQISKASFSDSLHSINSMPLLQVKDIVWIVNLPSRMSITDLHKIQSSFQTAVCPQSADKMAHYEESICHKEESLGL